MSGSESLRIAFLSLAAALAATTSTLADTAILTTATGSHPVEVEIADTPKSREIGLMNREELAEGSGMLFDFHENRPVSMWMKNTLIPLDMVFIDKTGTVVRVARNAKPHSLEVIPSDKPVRYVLEINGGAAATYGVKAGDRVEHPIIKP